MSFTSLTFWVFLAVIFMLYWQIRDKRLQNLILTLASFLFYGWVEPWLAFMLGISTLVDYLLAKWMTENRSRTRLSMSFSIVLNLCVLAFFKYYNFFHDDLARIATALGMQSDFLLTRVLLPAGLSFYTLKKLGYMIDVARGALRHTPSMVDFVLYVSFFPQVVAGPIDRPQKLMPQIESPRTWKADYFHAAWPLIVMGLFKKLVIAGSVGPITDRIFRLEEPTILLAITGALGFTLQILADFSAYTDLSRGIAYLLGFDTSENFKSPYLSLTPTEFWNRWHITLSFWLRDYIFFPIRRFLLSRQHRPPEWIILAVPPLVTMLLSGVWHGAGLTYLIWGGMYGILIVAYQVLGLGGNWRPASQARTVLAWLIMFAFIVFGWLVFAAPSVGWVINIFSNPLLGSREEQAVALIGLSIVAVYSIPMLAKVMLDRYSKQDSIIRSLYYTAATMTIFLYVNSTTPDFIYFQF